jgi:hypothetical protein
MNPRRTRSSSIPFARRYNFGTHASLFRARGASSERYGYCESCPACVLRCSSANRSAVQDCQSKVSVDQLYRPLCVYCDSSPPLSLPPHRSQTYCGPLRRLFWTDRPPVQRRDRRGKPIHIALTIECHLFDAIGANASIDSVCVYLVL